MVYGLVCLIYLMVSVGLWRINDLFEEKSDDEDNRSDLFFIILGPVILVILSIVGSVLSKEQLIYFKDKIKEEI